jgi:hypothetical protein
MDWKTYKDNKDKFVERQKQMAEEIKVCANRLFSSEDGQKLANQMLTAVYYFDVLPANLSDNDLRYIQAQRDFVNMFLTGLVEKKYLLAILEKR